MTTFEKTIWAFLWTMCFLFLSGFTAAVAQEPPQANAVTYKQSDLRGSWNLTIWAHSLNTVAWLNCTIKPKATGALRKGTPCKVFFPGASGTIPGKVKRGRLKMLAGGKITGFIGIEQADWDIVRVQISRDKLTFGGAGMQHGGAFTATFQAIKE